MKYTQTKIPDVWLLEPKVFGDERGFFMETFRQSEFDEIVGKRVFVQDNHSKSKQGILRGLHYQTKHPQGKLVRVVSGEVFDVAVDIRRNSPTFGQWVGEYLSAENKKMLWVPEGFAHGFITISETAEFLYKTTNYYAPDFERCIAWNDADINICWPKNIEPLLSSKDKLGESFSSAEVFNSLEY